MYQLQVLWSGVGWPYGTKGSSSPLAWAAVIGCQVHVMVVPPPLEPGLPGVPGLPAETLHVVLKRGQERLPEPPPGDTAEARTAGLLAAIPRLAAIREMTTWVRMTC
jgi:hypothetical protein